MSAVLCLPACLCVSPQRPVARPPTGTRQCDTRDNKGGLVHAPACDMQDRYVVQGTKQETNTGGKAKMPDHYRCTFTCAFCGRNKHYEDVCYHKQHLSANLKGETQNGGKGGRGNSEEGKGKSQSRGTGHEQGKEGPWRPEKKIEKYQDRPG